MDLRARTLAILFVSGALLATAAPAHASWSQPPSWGWHPVRIDQSWLADPPERPGVHARARIAVFEFRGDDVYQPLRASVVRVLRRRGLPVTVTLRSIDGGAAAEFRETSTEANIAVYVAGELGGQGERQSALLTFTSGLTGHRMSSARFSGSTDKIVADVARELWTRVGPGITRARLGAAKPRRREREPLVIDAGNPEDS